MEVMRMRFDGIATGTDTHRRKYTQFILKRGEKTIGKHHMRLLNIDIKLMQANRLYEDYFMSWMSVWSMERLMLEIQNEYLMRGGTPGSHRNRAKTGANAEGSDEINAEGHRNSWNHNPLAKSASQWTINTRDKHFNTFSPSKTVIRIIRERTNKHLFHSINASIHSIQLHCAHHSICYDFNTN